MGLDITVKTTVEDVLDCLEDHESVTHPEIARNLLESQTRSGIIHTAPGSYAGLHRLRKAFIELKGLPNEPGILDKDQGVPEAHQQYHLLNHSDAEGWYLPDDFDEPVWLNQVSVGSSVRLLAELQELEIQRATPSAENWGGAWDAIYLAAVASVVTRTPIKFH